MDLATVLLLHKCSFIVGAICCFYVRWRSREPGLDFLAIGEGLLAFASTLAGVGEQGILPYEVWTFGSFSVGVIGYALMAMGFDPVERPPAKEYGLLSARCGPDLVGRCWLYALVRRKPNARCNIQCEHRGFPWGLLRCHLKGFFPRPLAREMGSACIARGSDGLFDAGRCRNDLSAVWAGRTPLCLFHAYHLPFLCRALRGCPGPGTSGSSAQNVWHTPMH